MDEEAAVGDPVSWEREEQMVLSRISCLFVRAGLTINLLAVSDAQSRRQSPSYFWHSQHVAWSGEFDGQRGPRSEYVSHRPTV